MGHWADLREILHRASPAVVRRQRRMFDYRSPMRGRACRRDGIFVPNARLPLLGLAEIGYRRCIRVDNSLGKQVLHALATARIGTVDVEHIIEAVIFADDHDDVTNRAPWSIGCEPR